MPDFADRVWGEAVSGVDGQLDFSEGVRGILLFADECGGVEEACARVGEIADRRKLFPRKGADARSARRN